MSVISLIIACILLLLTPTKAPKNFSQAKRIAVTIHQNAVTFYCGCPITWHGQQGTPNLAACGYKIRKDVKRARRIEWEHVVPAWQFGNQRICWQQGGRSGCENRDPLFNQIEADLHNLQPVIGEVNSDRKHFPFTEWSGGSPTYGRCPIKIDFKNRRVEPPKRVRGAIARIYLYMGERYQLNYTQQQLNQFKRWHKRYPVTSWECKRDKKIAKYQGNHNPYVAQACK